MEDVAFELSRKRKSNLIKEKSIGQWFPNCVSRYPGVPQQKRIFHRSTVESFKF